MEKPNYEGRIIHPFHLIAVVLMSLISIAMFYGTLKSWNEYGYRYLTAPIFLGTLAVTGWLDIFFGRLIVDREGIVQKRPGILKKLPFFHDILYASEKITEVKLRGNFAKIGYRTKFLSPGWVFVTKPEEFAKAVKEYIPEKTIIRKLGVKQIVTVLILILAVVGLIRGVFPHEIEGQEYVTITSEMLEAREFIKQYPSARTVVREKVLLGKVEVLYIMREQGKYTPAITLMIKLDKGSKAVERVSLDCRYKEERVVHKKSDAPLEWLKIEECPGIEKM